jgi:hypothetical protein
VPARLASRIGLEPGLDRLDGVAQEAARLLEMQLEAGTLDRPIVGRPDRALRRRLEKHGSYPKVRRSV